MTLKEVQDNIRKKEYVKARENMDALRREGYEYNDVMAILDANIYEALGDRANMFRSIRDSMQYSHRNYELYYMLG